MEMYSNEQIKEFGQEYEKLESIEKEIDNLNIGDLKPYKIKRIVQKTLKTINEYKEKVPKEFRKTSEVNKLEEKILNLQKDFAKD